MSAKSVVSGFYMAKQPRMPTTSGELARVCLAGLTEAGVRFAVLHGYEHLETDRISDVDIVVGQDPRVVIREAEGSWRERGLVPIIMWPYDIGATVTLFLATRDANDGVQLDMLYDPEGIGRYGVRSNVLLRYVEERPLAPVVERAARLLYLWQKRTAKDQAERLDSLRQEAIGIDPDRLESMSREITGSASSAWGLVGSGVVTTPRRRLAVIARLSRLATRIRHPIGAWVHVSLDDVGSELTRRLSRHLIIVRSARLPPLVRQAMWYLVDVAPVRYRPGIFISVGRRHKFALAPDVEIVGTQPDQAAVELMEALKNRTMSCVS